MAITKQKKGEVIEELNRAFDSARVVVFTDYKGINVNSLTRLRNKVRQSGGQYYVAKKTLIKKSLDERKMEGLNPLEMDGQIGIAFGTQDAVATSKAVYDIQKEGEILKILGGLMDDRVLSSEQIIQLAKLPTRNELLASVLRSFKAPINGFVNVLRGNLGGLLNVLNAIKEQKS